MNPFDNPRAFWTDEDIRFILTHSADIVWRIDPAFNFTHVNSADSTIWGYTREEILRVPLSRVLTPESMIKVGAMNRQRMEAEARGEKTGTVWVQAKVIAKDGTHSWAEVTSTPERDESGRITGFCGVTRDITARKTAEERLAEERAKLAESERRYRTIVDSSPISLLVHREGVFLYANPAAVELFGAESAEALVGQPVLDRVHPAYREIVTERTRQVLEKRLPEPMREEKCLRLDGTPVDIRVADTVIYFEGELANLAMIEDISEHKRAAEALAEKTAEAANFFQLSLDLLCIADLDGYFLRLNPSWEATLGYKLSELVGRRYLDFIHPDDVEATKKASARLADGQNVLSFTNRYRCADGSYRWIEWRTAPFDNRLIYAAARDITERREMEERLAERELHLRSLVEASPMGIHEYRLEEDGRLVFTGANPAADRILGVDNSMFVGMTIEQAFPPLAATAIPATYRKIAATGENWTDEQIYYADGAITGAYQVFGFRTAGTSMAAMFLDITGRKRAEEEKRKLEEDLLQAQKMEAIGRLAGGVAHDFNNLLTAIIGYCDLAALKNSNAQLPPEINSIRLAADKAASLTQQLLAFSRKQILQPKVINPADVVTDAQKMLGRLLGEDIQLSVRLSGDTGHVLADPGQLTQVIMNLALNARDAMPGGGMLSIETRNALLEEHSPLLKAGGAPGFHVLVSVTDTGLGMDEATKARIFEPFFTTKALGKGTGLGLATVHGIVTQSGGSISVDSQPNKGTRFTICLPRVEPPEALQPQEKVQPPRGGSETILLVEDSPDVRVLAMRSLEALGYKVLAAETGEDALNAVARHPGPVDLLLTDVVMPGMSGRELADELWRNWPKLPVLFMSGYTEDAIVHHGVLDDGINFIQKPFSPRKLAEQVRSILDARR